MQACLCNTNCALIIDSVSSEATMFYVCSYLSCKGNDSMLTSGALATLALAQEKVDQKAATGPNIANDLRTAFKRC